MCLNALFLQLVIIGALFIGIYGYRKMFQNARINFENLSGLLQSPCSYGLFPKMTLEGYYKGRRVVLSYFMFGNNANFLGPYIEPRVSFRQSIFSLHYRGITENTKLIGNKIYYNRLGPLKQFKWSLYWGNIRLFGRDEFSGILEELTRAAEMVEKNPEGYGI